MTGPVDEHQARVQAIADYLLNELSTVVVGQRENLRLLLATVLTGGHVLLEDRPGAVSYTHLTLPTTPYV